MIKSLPKTSHQLAVCEANFLRLKKILNDFSKNKFSFETINPDSSSNPISFCIIHRTRHTLIVEAKQKIKLKKIESDNNFNSYEIFNCTEDSKSNGYISNQKLKKLGFVFDIYN